MSKIVIFGTGQIAELAHFYFLNDSEHDVAGFTVDTDFLERDEFKGLPVVPYSEILGVFPPSEYKLFIPISFKGMNRFRAEKFLDAKDQGYRFVTYISSKASYYDTPVGENCFIMENNVIQPFSTIGDNCILWSGNHIGHHSAIGDHCFLASHVVVSGSVSVGERTFIGVNATIRDNVIIGRENLIGAGALVSHSTKDRAVVAPRATSASRVPSNRIKHI